MRVMVVGDGGLGSLTAAVLCRSMAEGEGRSAWIGVWVCGPGSSLGDVGVGVESEGWVERQRAVVPYAEVVSGEGAVVVDGDVSGAVGIGALVELVQAGLAAESRGCERLVWGVHGGDDLERVAGLTGLVSGVNGALTAAGAVVRVEVPLVDLTAGGVREVALDAGVPMGLVEGEGLAGAG